MYDLYIVGASCGYEEVVFVAVVVQLVVLAVAQLVGCQLDGIVAFYRLVVVVFDIDKHRQRCAEVVGVFGPALHMDGAMQAADKLKVAVR